MVMLSTCNTCPSYWMVFGDMIAAGVCCASVAPAAAMSQSAGGLKPGKKPGTHQFSGAAWCFHLLEEIQEQHGHTSFCCALCCVSGAVSGHCASPTSLPCEIQEQGKLCIALYCDEALQVVCRDCSDCLGPSLPRLLPFSCEANGWTNTTSSYV